MIHKHKRNILTATAIAGAACAAAAQSSVTIFGVLDVAISHYSAVSGRSSLAARGASSRVHSSQAAMSNGALIPSRLGFRGTEDLGGGYAAGFWLETPLWNDEGGPALTFARRSTLSLLGPFGELRLGRDYSPTFLVDTRFDPFNNAGVGANLIGAVNGRLATVSAAAGGGPLRGGLPGGGPDNYVRASNSIGYFLPPGLGGFTGQAIYALHENEENSNGATRTSRRGGALGVGLGWSRGPIAMGASYVESIPVDGVSAASVYVERKLKTANVSVSYDFGVAKLFGELSQARDVARSTTVLVSSRATDRYNGAMVGLTVPAGPAGLIRAGYSRVNFDDNVGLDASASKFALGYVYDLSKRTAVYATAARIRIKHGQNNPGVMGVTTGVGAPYQGTGGFAPRSATGYDVGIRHAF